MSEFMDDVELEVKIKPKYCASCGLEIEGSYLKIGDNYLQAHYFDDEDTENIFCSETCLCHALSVIEVDENGDELCV